MGRRLGLTIGINHYQDAAFRPLQFAEMDARALAQWLVNAKGGKWGPGDVQMLLGTHATRELVESLIIQLCVNTAGPDDVVVVYFAGHAFLDEASGDGYLALANTRYQARTAGLHLPSLASQAMGRSRAGHIVFIFDYFQTGRLWSTRRSSLYDSRPLPGPSLINTLQQVGNRLLLCSCRGNEFAPEMGEQNLGLLLHRLILGLCGPASDPTTGQVSLQRLYGYLDSTLDEQHRPQLFGQERTPLTLVGELPPASPPQGLQAPGASSPVAARDIRPVTNNQVAQAIRAAASIAQLSPQQPATSTDPPGSSQADQQRQQQSTLLLQQARYLIQLQKPDEAAALLDQALLAMPTNTAALILKGQLLGTAGRFPEAMFAVEQLLQLEPNNALGWSMRAALLANMGNFEEALQAVERSLALDPHNAETLAIKSTIMVKLAVAQTPGTSSTSQPLKSAPLPKQGDPASFFIGAGIQFFGLILGIGGAGLQILHPGLPIALTLSLESLGLALLCANSARGAYLYGITRFLLTLLTSGLAAVILVLTLLIRSNQTRVLQVVKDHPSLLVPLAFLALWLALAALLPLFAGLGGWISGALRGTRRRS